MEPCTSHLNPPPPPKIKKNSSEKKSLYFRGWNFLALIFKKSYIISKESFSYISQNGTLYFSVQARKIKNNPLGEKFLYFRKRNFQSSKSEKKPLLKCFLYFRKFNFSTPNLKKSYFFRRTT